jgi:Domain of unknown function (DUF4920)
MKKVLIGIFVAALMTVNAYSQDSFGKKIEETNAIPAEQLPATIGDKTTLNTKITGKVESVCQVKGCWMKVLTADGQTMRVSFKDYGFFVPKDIAGKTVVFEGEAKVKTTSVAELRHYAEDAKKPKAEIMKITEPKRELTFVADGVIVKK